MTGSPAPWPTTGPATPSGSKARHAALRKLRLLETITTPCQRRFASARTSSFSSSKANPAHPSQQFKKIGERHGQEIWSVRVTLRYRALAVRLPDEYLWFWIGDHSAYDSILS
jgi:hypothetical protein